MVGAVPALKETNIIPLQGISEMFVGNGSEAVVLDALYGGSH